MQLILKFHNYLKFKTQKISSLKYLSTPIRAQPQMTAKRTTKLANCLLRKNSWPLIKLSHACQKLVHVELDMYTAAPLQKIRLPPNTMLNYYHPGHHLAKSYTYNNTCLYIYGWLILGISLLTYILQERFEFSLLAVVT